MTGQETPKLWTERAQQVSMFTEFDSNFTGSGEECH